MVMDGNTNLKDFFLGLLSKMMLEDVGSLDVTVDLIDKRCVFDISLRDIEPLPAPSPPASKAEGE